jgi:hypothetical protein
LSAEAVQELLILAASLQTIFSGICTSISGTRRDVTPNLDRKSPASDDRSIADSAAAILHEVDKVASQLDKITLSGVSSDITSADVLNPKRTRDEGDGHSDGKPSKKRRTGK